MAKRVVFYVRTVDGERVDRIVFEAGTVLIDNQSTKRPLINVSQLVAVEFFDDGADEEEAPDVA